MRNTRECGVPTRPKHLLLATIIPTEVGIIWLHNANLCESMIIVSGASL